VHTGRERSYNEVANRVCDNVSSRDMPQPNLASTRLGTGKQLDSGVNAALVTVPVFKTGETSYTDVWWVRFPYAPAVLFHEHVRC